jgi:hypothetical protein
LAAPGAAVNQSGRSFVARSLSLAALQFSACPARSVAGGPGAAALQN